MRLFINNKNLEFNSNKELLFWLIQNDIKYKNIMKAESITIETNKIVVFGIECILQESTY